MKKKTEGESEKENRRKRESEEDKESEEKEERAERRKTKTTTKGGKARKEKEGLMATSLIVSPLKHLLTLLLLSNIVILGIPLLLIVGNQKIK